MITVTNRIRVKKGMAEKMAPMFTKGGPLETFEGFQKVEVLVSTQFDDHDEMSVVMYWDNEESFNVWRESDEFKAAHKRPEGVQPNADSPMLGSQIVIAKVAGSLVKA